MKQLKELFAAGSKKVQKPLAVVGLTLGGASVAMADSASAVAKFGAAESDVSAIGWAGIGLLIAAVMFKYMRKAA